MFEVIIFNLFIIIIIIYSPSFIIYPLAIHWAWQFNIIFLKVNIRFESYCDHYIISTNNKNSIIYLLLSGFLLNYSSFITIIIIISVFLYWDPDILGNSDNQIIANPLITPNNILPEWYYLLFYSCQRLFNNKTIGLILVLNILLLVFVHSLFVFMYFLLLNYVTSKAFIQLFMLYIRMTEWKSPFNYYLQNRKSN